MQIPVNRVTVEPAIEPVTVPDVKANAFIVDDTSYDDYIKQQLIPEARRFVEKLANRSLITQTRAQYYDTLPETSQWYGPTREAAFNNLSTEMFLRYGPTQSVSSITYKDSNAASQTLSTDLYTVDTQSIPARVNQTYNQVYPLSITDTNSVVVTMVNGYGSTVASVPIIYRRAIILWCSMELNNRVPIACAEEYAKSLDALISMLQIEGATCEYV